MTRSKQVLSGTNMEKDGPPIAAANGEIGLGMTV